MTDPGHDMGLPEQIVITVVYLITMFLLAVFPNTLGLGRPLMAMIGAAINIFIQGLVEGTRNTWEEDIDFDVIFFLFGLMIISHYMSLTGFNRFPRYFLDLGARKTASTGPYLLLWIVCTMTSVIAMFFTNDMAVYLLTPEIVRLSFEYPSFTPATGIFLIAVATSANIGAAISPIGSPQNALIHSISPCVSSGDFWKYLSLPTFAIMFLNSVCLHIWLWISTRRRPKGMPLPESQFAGGSEENPAEGKPMLATNLLPADMKYRLSMKKTYSIQGEDDDWGVLGQQDDTRSQVDREDAELNRLKEQNENKVKNILSVISALVFIGWIVCVSITPVYLGWTTLLASLTIMLTHAAAVKWFGDAGDWSPDKDVFRSGKIIDFGLLFLFQGMFILVGSLLDTGLPEQIFDMLFSQTGDEIVELWLVMILLYSILAASNILSNVPVIMLLEPLIVKLADPLLGWMIVAWASTIAGNLTLVGSAANLIVSERSRQAGGPDMTFFGHFPYGFTSTVVFSFIGLLLLLWVYPDDPTPCVYP